MKSDASYKLNIKDAYKFFKVTPQIKSYYKGIYKGINFAFEFSELTDLSEVIDGYEEN